MESVSFTSTRSPCFTHALDVVLAILSSDSRHVFAVTGVRPLLRFQRRLVSGNQEAGRLRAVQPNRHTYMCSYYLRGDVFASKVTPSKSGASSYFGACSLGVCDMHEHRSDSALAITFIVGAM